MRLLLDTHVLLWWLSNNPALGTEARTAIADPDASVFVSAATAWEIAIKQAAGRLNAPGDIEYRLESNRFQQLPITIPHAVAAGALPRHHNDPFDRMLVAQAVAEQMTLLTSDGRMALYEVQVFPAER